MTSPPDRPPTDHPAHHPHLTDGIVHLQALTAEDLAGLRAQASASVMLRDPGLEVDGEPEAFLSEALAGWQQGTRWTFNVTAPDEDGSPRHVGTVSLHDRGHGRAQLAFGSLPWSRDRGYVVRALDLLLGWGFQERGVESVLWTAERGNWASRKVAWRLGFTFVGTVRRWHPADDRLDDAWVGVLSAADERRPGTPWFEVPRITAPRVMLRAPRAGDVQRIVEGCSDERTSYWLTQLPTPYTTGDAEAYLESRREQRATGAGLTWAVTAAGEDELLGLVSLFDVDPGDDAEVGYWFHPDARGRGVATESCRLAVRHAFVPAEDGGLGLRRLRAEVAEGNEESLRVLERAGFTATGRHRAAHRRRDGSTGDLLCFDLLLAEYADG